MATEFITYLLSQAFILIGVALFAWIFGRALASGFSRELKNAVPRWIHAFRKEMMEERAIIKALEDRKKYE